MLIIFNYAIHIYSGRRLVLIIFNYAIHIYRLVLLYLTMQYIYSQGGGWCSLYLTMLIIFN